MAIGQGMQVTQNQTQAQKLALTQSMRQSILVLQLDTIDLTKYLQDTSLGNPLMDVRTKLDQPTMIPKVYDQYQQADNQGSLFDYLLEQVQLTMRHTPLRTLVIYLIKQLDPRGYLPMSDQQIMAELGVDAITLMDAQTLLQQLDPPGIGARNLQECLILQAEADSEYRPKGVLAVLQHHFSDLVVQHFNRIRTDEGLSTGEWQRCFEYIQTLSSNPGLPYNKGQTSYLIPELRVSQQHGRLSLSIIKQSQPQLVFAGETYDNLKKTTDLEVQHYLKEKLGEYQALKYSLQRREATLELIGRELVRAQYAFFMQQQTTLNPLLLRDVAQKLQLAESTVSRAINGKYIQTDFGVFAVKTLFSRYAVGKAQYSIDQVKAQLQRLIENENHTQPLVDDQLVKELTSMGITIARRTVAKYRKELGWPSARLRKR